MGSEMCIRDSTENESFTFNAHFYLFLQDVQLSSLIGTSLLTILAGDKTCWRCLVTDGRNAYFGLSLAQNCLIMESTGIPPRPGDRKVLNIDEVNLKRNI